MTKLDQIFLRVGVKHQPKAKPLAEAFIAEAIRQGATLGEFKSAVDVAVSALEGVMDPNGLFVEGYAGKVEAVFKSL